MKGTHLHTVFVLAIIFFLASALSGCKEKKRGAHEINPMIEQLDTTPDYALFVHLDRVANDSMYVTVRGEGTKAVYGFAEAMAAGQVKGSIHEGDSYSIFPDRKNKRVSIVINTTELKGRWYYDMTQHRGFDFGAFGALSAINNVLISYREWKLLNGKLYLYYVDMQQDAPDRHEFLVDEAEILYLDKDNMQLQFRGETLNCRRQHEVIKFGKKHAK